MNSDMNPNSNIEEAKNRLPLPKLMQELGYGDRAKSSARCMFHTDKTPSFGIFQREGQWFWKCQAGCGHGNEIHFLAKVKGIYIKEATKEFLRMAGVESKAKAITPDVPVSALQQAEAPKATAPPKPKRDRIEKLETPIAPVTFDQWRDVIEANFPALVRPAEVCLTVVAQLLLNDISNPFALALVDVPSSGKTITLNFFSGLQELAYTSDSFSAASFVSHASNVKREDLARVDLLPRIQYRTLIIRELGAVFGSKDDDLIKSLGILTRVLDGEGLQTDSGIHGQRGYSGDYLFMLLAGTTPMPPRVFKIMGNFGSRLFFLELHTPEEDDDGLIAQNLGSDRKAKESECRNVTTDFLRTLWAANPNGIEWNKVGDPKECLRVIARCARLLAALRGAINVWSVGDDGEKLTHSVPVIEKASRINCLLYNLARAHALVRGRRQLTSEDLWPVLDLAFDSAPRNRAKLFRGMIEADGEMGTAEVMSLLNCSRPTALKEMEALSILGIVNKSECPDQNGRPGSTITIKEKFNWFVSSECKDLMEVVNKGNAPCVCVNKDIHTPALGDSDDKDTQTQGGNPLLTHPVAGINDGVAATVALNKGIAPCIISKILWPGDEKAWTHLAAVMEELRIDVADGLWPRDKVDCSWGEDYPSEYTAAQDLLDGYNRGEHMAPDLDSLLAQFYSDQGAFGHLSSLLCKIEILATRGTPLCSNNREWCDGDYPQAFLDATAYRNEQVAKAERELLAA